MKRSIVIVFTSLVLAVPGRAQQERAAAPASSVAAADPADVESIAAILAALYDVISGPAGERDWNRFRSLFAPHAVLSPMAPRPDTGETTLRVLTVEEYVERAGAAFAERPFYEVESGRILERFGNVASAMSAYESRTAPEEEPFSRGVNAITLLHDGERWFVLSIAWDVDREGNPLAPEYGRE